MSNLPTKIARAQALRDAARQVVRDDLTIIREDLSPRRIGARVEDAAAEAAEKTSGFAEEHRAGLAALGVATLLWLARTPILSALGELFGGSVEEEPDEPEEPEEPMQNNYTQTKEPVP